MHATSSKKITRSISLNESVKTRLELIELNSFGGAAGLDMSAHTAIFSATRTPQFVKSPRIYQRPRGRDNVESPRAMLLQPRLRPFSRWEHVCDSIGANMFHQERTCLEIPAFAV
eukprot:m.820869 g.820869  ORF g.820869 m.820869 type:complete len:115 (-) comp23398_c2_seq13:1346-1690(-)